MTPKRWPASILWDRGDLDVTAQSGVDPGRFRPASPDCACGVSQSPMLQAAYPMYQPGVAVLAAPASWLCALLAMALYLLAIEVCFRGVLPAMRACRQDMASPGPQPAALCRDAPSGPRRWRRCRLALLRLPALAQRDDLAGFVVHFCSQRRWSWLAWRSTAPRWPMKPGETMNSLRFRSALLRLLLVTMPFSCGGKTVRAVADCDLWQPAIVALTTSVLVSDGG